MCDIVSIDLPRFSFIFQLVVMVLRAAKETVDDQVRSIIQNEIHVMYLSPIFQVTPVHLDFLAHKVCSDIGSSMSIINWVIVGYRGAKGEPGPKGKYISDFFNF